MGRQFQSRTCVQSSKMTNTALKGAYQSLRHAVEQTMARNLFRKTLEHDCSRGMIVLCKRRPYHRLEIVRTLSAAPVSIQIQPSSAPAPYQSCVHQCQIQLSVNIQLILRLCLLVQVIINRNQ